MRAKQPPRTVYGISWNGGLFCLHGQPPPGSAPEDAPLIGTIPFQSTVSAADFRSAGSVSSIDPDELRALSDCVRELHRLATGSPPDRESRPMIIVTEPGSTQIVQVPVRVEAGGLPLH